MSTYYALRCTHCDEVGGDFTRQVWGWGNADPIENTIFLMAHTACAISHVTNIDIISEHADAYNDKTARAKWRARVEDPGLRTWPHTDYPLPSIDEWRAQWLRRNELQ